MLITSDEWGELDPGARTAILEWNRMGGKIVIYSSNASDDLATLQIDANMPGKKSTARSFGTDPNGSSTATPPATCGVSCG